MPYQLDIDDISSTVRFFKDAHVKRRSAAAAGSYPLADVTTVRSEQGIPPGYVRFRGHERLLAQ